MHAKPDLRVFLEWLITGSGSVITDVIPLEFMQTVRTTNPSRRTWIQGILPALFLADVGLMFLGLFVANAMAWWIWLPFHFVSICFAIAVVVIGHVATKEIPQSIPFQYLIGSALFLSCHSIVFFGSAQIPIWLAGYLMFAGPMASILLFDTLHGGEPEEDVEQMKSSA